MGNVLVEMGNVLVEMTDGNRNAPAETTDRNGKRTGLGGNCTERDGKEGN
jgi:hypothetical protein